MLVGTIRKLHFRLGLIHGESLNSLSTVNVINISAAMLQCVGFPHFL